MTIEEMKNRNRELGYSYEEIAELSGVEQEIIQAIFDGVVSFPRYDVLQALERIFAPEDSCIIREPKALYHAEAKKEQGEYTVEDYLAWPEDERIELIDGIIYDMAAPTGIHQLIAGKLHAVFLAHIEKNKGGCIPVISPIDVQLDEDNKTMVQPDVIILCDKNKFKKGRVFGAPDLVVEVLSPSTRKKDSYLKLSKYFNAGVREYWMIDPTNKRVIVYDLEHDEPVALYNFEDKVPVKIFENKCEVDFSEIYDYISFLYEDE